MTNLAKIQLLMRYIDADCPVHGSYKVIDGVFTHMHYGRKTTEVKTFPRDEDLSPFVDNIMRDYANQMRVSVKLVRKAFCMSEPIYSREKRGKVNGE